jgi:hypothetical protein
MNMKRIVPLIGFVLLLASCGSEEKKEKNKSEKTDPVIKENVKDTITFTLEDIDKNTYCKLVEKSGYCGKVIRGEWEDDSLKENRLIEAYPRIVSRNGNRISFLVGKNNLDFKDTQDEMSGDYVRYRLIDMNDEYAVLAMIYYEGYEYMVLNHKTGKSFKTWGRPIFNNGGTMAVSGNCDLQAGFSNNGFQIFVNEDGKWNLKMERLLDDWGPAGLWWVNDSVICSKKITVTEADSTGNGTNTSYVKILLKKEKIN